MYSLAVSNCSIRKLSAIGYSNTISAIRNYIHVVHMHIGGTAVLMFSMQGLLSEIEIPICLYFYVYE